MKLTVPNVLSLLRIPIGVLVAIAGTVQAWDWAFALYLTGCATDLADGYVAKRWNCGTDFGANVLEPVCDFALTVGALTGLVLSRHIPVPLIVLMAVAAAIGQIICSFFTKTVLFQYFGMWFMPCYYLAVTSILAFDFAYLALSRPKFFLFSVLSMGFAMKLVEVKRHRFAAWFSGFSRA